MFYYKLTEDYYKLNEFYTLFYVTIKLYSFAQNILAVNVNYTTLIISFCKLILGKVLSVMSDVKTRI